MKIKFCLAAVLALTLLFTFRICPAAEINLPGKSQAQVCFSPRGGCLAAVIQAVARARSEILIQAYSFRSPVLAQALIAAHLRGVKVELILDKSERQEGLTPAVSLANAGIPVHMDNRHVLANNRVVVIDRQTLITGSFGFDTVADEMNAENLLILQSPELAALYRENWLQHRQHTEPL